MPQHSANSRSANSRKMGDIHPGLIGPGGPGGNTAGAAVGIRPCRRRSTTDDLRGIRGVTRDSVTRSDSD
eukprot:93182-Hanusia_phi.AAC.2